MYIYGMKLLPKKASAVLLNEECEPVGMIHIVTAADIINQGRKTGMQRWIASYDSFKGIFPNEDGRTVWFDRARPLYVPDRYLLEIKFVSGEV